MPGGSPPRVREKLIKGLEILPQIGITPASAGKTENGKHAIACARDHPRECGKNFTYSL